MNMKTIGAVCESISMPRLSMNILAHVGKQGREREREGEREGKRERQRERERVGESGREREIERVI